MDNEQRPSFFGKPFLFGFLSLIIDLIGCATFALPLVGEAADAIWSPISAFLIYTIYKDPLYTTIGFIEEALPLTDIIPTASLCWLRHYGKNIPHWLNSDSAVQRGFDISQAADDAVVEETTWTNPAPTAPDWDPSSQAC